MGLEWVVDLFNKYWYVLLIILGIVVIYFYTKLDTYTKLRIQHFFSLKLVLFLALILGWYFWARFGGITTTKSANMYMPIFGLLFLAGMNYIGKLRYETQQLITPNLSGSYSKPPILYNGFYIFALDSFNAGGLAWDYAKRICVLREETTQFYERGAVSIARPKKCSIYDLSQEIKSIIEDDVFLRGAASEIYFGWFDDLNEVDWEFEQLKDLEKIKNNPNHIYNLVKRMLGVENPRVSSLYWAYMNESKARNKQTEVLDSVVEGVEKGVEHHKRIKDTYTDKRDNLPVQTKDGYEEY